MAEFIDFKTAVQKQFKKMIAEGKPLFFTNISVVKDMWFDTGKDKLWETYLESFPEEMNQIYRERRAHDCSLCRNFVRAYGNIVTINEDLTLSSIWDIEISDPGYTQVAVAMSEYVKSFPIDTVFYGESSTLGTPFNHELVEGESKVWNHFSLNLPREYVTNPVRIASEQSYNRASQQTLLRALRELKPENVETVQELIAEKKLYRGEEHLKILNDFQALQASFQFIEESKQENFAWIASLKNKVVSGIRNSVIGSLLLDLGEKSLEDAVNAFEKKVAPENYKRPTALVTKSMIQDAQNEVEELGLTNSLARRFAKIGDLNVTNTLYVNREIKAELSNPFDAMKQEVKVDPDRFKNVEAISIETFVTDVLPNIETLEILVENNHEKHLMSLLAPEDPEAKSLFNWKNGFSWTYNGNLADSSISQRVKEAGGKVEDAFIRVSLSWNNASDLDLHVIEPGGNRIYYGAKQSFSTTGHLDVDMHVGSHRHPTMQPVENITWTDPEAMKEGVYTVLVNNFDHRSSKNVGFSVEIAFDGNTYEFAHPKDLKSGINHEVLTFTWSKAEGFVIKNAPPVKTLSRDIWGLMTNTFYPVSVVMNSPNYWEEPGVGNRHLFFILKDAINKGQPRGFFNEFLRSDLTPHRKVFEILGSKMVVPQSSEQVSGLGFSSTKKGTVVCKTTGTYSRTFKVNF